MNNLYVREPCQSPEHTVCPAPALPHSFADVAAGVDKDIGKGQSHVILKNRIMVKMHDHVLFLGFMHFGFTRHNRL